MAETPWKELKRSAEQRTLPEDVLPNIGNHGKAEHFKGGDKNGC